MKSENNLDIVTNAKGQRILLIDENFQILEHYNIKYDEFDAMMFLSENGGLVATQFLHLNPLTQKLFYLKPFFINPKVVNLPFLKEASDGLSNDSNEPIVMSKIQEILERIKELNIEIKDEELKRDEKTILVSIFRFFLSRDGIPTPVLKKCSTLGYTIPIYEFYSAYQLFPFQSINAIYREYIGNKYIEYIDAIDIVQYCKYCNHSHIIYTEICPKCGSFKITLQNMLHHFVCANITVEASYMVKDHLICPKCKKELHHIGVDYDRPASIYKCDDCNASFTQANMRGTCVTCRKVSSLNELRRVTIPYLKFTSLGVKEISQWSIYESDGDVAVCAGFLSLNSFVEHITKMTQIHNLSSNNNELTTIRVKGISLSEVEAVSLFIFNNIINSQCTFKDDYIYIALIYSDENSIQNYSKLLDDKMKKMKLNEYVGVDYVNYTEMISVKNYLRKLF